MNFSCTKLFRLILKLLNAIVLLLKVCSCGLNDWDTKANHSSSFLKGLGYDVIVNEEFCDGCQFGKHHKSSFGTRLVRSQKPRDVIYSDVCKPMETESLGGIRFFVVFKDDYSKFRKVCFIKEKSEVVEKLKLYNDGQWHKVLQF